MLFFKNSIENEPILSRRYDCQESMPVFKNSIENEPILSGSYDCPESMLSDGGRLQEPTLSSTSQANVLLKTTNGMDQYCAIIIMFF